MRALVQRISEASVTVDDKTVARSKRGLLIFVGVGRSDTNRDADYLASKVLKLRVFPDENGKMNSSVLEVGGDLLIVSQFTLYGDTTKGNRPSYTDAAAPGAARDLYELFVERCRESGLATQSGVFQAHMDVHLVNDGPVTFLCHSESAARQV